jgi:hypothetical protein
MKTEKAIELQREQGSDRAARILAAALEAVREGRDPGIGVTIESRIRICGVNFWVWELGDELIDAYVTAFKSELNRHIQQAIGVHASVETVQLRAKQC